MCYNGYIEGDMLLEKWDYESGQAGKGLVIGSIYAEVD